MPSRLLMPVSQFWPVTSPRIRMNAHAVALYAHARHSTSSSVRSWPRVVTAAAQTNTKTSWPSASRLCPTPSVAAAPSRLAVASAPARTVSPTGSAYGSRITCERTDAHIAATSNAPTSARSTSPVLPGPDGRSSGIDTTATEMATIVSRQRASLVAGCAGFTTDGSTRTGTGTTVMPVPPTGPRVPPAAAGPDGRGRTRGGPRWPPHRRCRRAGPRATARGPRPAG